MDWAVTHRLNDFLAGRDGLEDVLTTYERFGEALFVLALLVLLVLAGPTLRRAAVAAAASTAVALAIGMVIARLVDRPRPFVTHHGVHLFASHAADAGFPSDHATGAFAIAGAVLAYDRRWGGLLVALAVVLAIGRVAIGVHYPTDVLAGALLGSMVAEVMTHGPIGRQLDRLADRLPARPQSRSAQPGSRRRRGLRPRSAR